MPTRYNRTLTELEANACKWWPENLVMLEAESSIIPTLVRTQDQFVSILTLSDYNNPESVFDVMAAAHFAANLFLPILAANPFRELTEIFPTISRTTSFAML